MCIVFLSFFFVSMFVTGLFCQRHCSHDSPVDVVFSYYPRCSVPLCVVQCGVCVYVKVYVTREERGEKEEEKEKRRRRQEKREEKERKEERGEEKTKDKMKNKKIMMWTDAEKGAHRRKLN